MRKNFPLDYDRSEAQRLLGRTALTSLNSDQLCDRAHRRWSKKEYREAALLFCAAAEAAKTEPPGPHGDQFMPAYARAAVTFNLAGDTGIATPMLHAVTRYDWAAAGVEEDSHFTEWVFCELLSNASALGRDAFEAQFAEAIKRCHELGWDFPFIHPKQETLLTMSLTLESEAMAHRIVGLMKSRKPLSREARRLLKTADIWLSRRGRAGA